MDENVEYIEPIENDPTPTKSNTRGERLLRSERARSQRQFVKAVRETRILNEWAKNKRLRKKSK